MFRRCLTLTYFQFVFNCVISSYCDYFINQFAILPFTQNFITSYAFFYITHFDILTILHFKIVYYFKFINN